jgi:hypothetical protein
MVEAGLLMMCVSHVKGQHFFECTVCDLCLPFRFEATADAYNLTHATTEHHKAMVSLAALEVNTNVAPAETN